MDSNAMGGGVDEPCCKACFSNDVTYLAEKGRRRAYRLYQCKCCGVQFWWPQETIGGEWYERNPSYIIRDQITFNVLGWGQQLFLSKRLNSLGVRLLDIGCGSGAFLATAEKIGYLVTGVDYDRKAIEKARAIYGLRDVWACELAAFCQQRMGEKFDIVTMWSILEHTVSPGEVMRLLLKLVHPNGHLFIEVPNRDTIASDAPPPQHWFRWNKESLGNMVRLHGWEVIDLIEKQLTLADMVTIVSSHLKFSYAWYRLFRRSLESATETGGNRQDSYGNAKIEQLYRRTRALKNAALRGSLLIPFIFYRLVGKKGPELYLAAVRRPESL
jgi:2-polyprenyl-3-methyl-5-hydroxy-6-metoxy-1,4-benzoquinol methylase